MPAGYSLRMPRLVMPLLRFLLFVLLCLSGLSSNGASEQPNIVFLIADDLGWKDVGFHGGSAPTPNLDALASESLELTRHYVAPVCSPTRVGLLTGRYWSRFGITTPTNHQALPFETMTLPRALKSQGYDTCLIGKWHLGSKAEWGPNHFGFDHSYGSLAGGVTAWSHRYKKGEFSVTWHRNHELIEEDGHVTDLLTSEAIQWISERDPKKPFFLYVPYTAVHLPVNEPEEWLEKVPDTITSEIGRHYAACIMHLDDSVGKIRAELDRRGLTENTILVFTSDNGGSTATNNTQPYPPDDSPSGKVPASNAPLRGEKGSIYEGGIRVPTLVSWPGKVKPGVNESPCFIGDWMPTFCEQAGFPDGSRLNWDGRSLAEPLLSGEDFPERPIYIAGIRSRSSALFSRGWKLLQHQGRDPELYSMKEDFREQQNLAGDQPEVVRAMVKILTELQESDLDSVVKAR
jgi:arylsulfatase A-like enzyme